YLRGKLELDSLRADRAEPWLRKAAALAPHDRLVLYQLGLCLKKLDKGQEAEHWMGRFKHIEAVRKQIKTLTQKLLRDPANPDLCCELGRIYLRNDSEGEGLHWLQSALHENPKHRPTHNALADYYQKSGKLKLAAHHRQMAQ